LNTLKQGNKGNYPDSATIQLKKEL